MNLKYEWHKLYDNMKIQLKPKSLRLKILANGIEVLSLSTLI